jgi:hypothetical protein
MAAPERSRRRAKLRGRRATAVAGPLERRCLVGGIASLRLLLRWAKNRLESTPYRTEKTP